MQCLTAKIMVVGGQAGAKRWSEAWFAKRRCPTCTVSSMRIVDEPARDIFCQNCGEFYEVKSTTNPAAASAAAGAATSYEERFTTEPPNLVLITYGTKEGYAARRATVVPRTVVDASLIRARPPSILHTGRVVRLCSLRLDEIPALARLPIHVAGCDIFPKATAGELRRWHSLRTSAGSRWHREVLRMIGWMNKAAFTRTELLQFRPWLAAQFPQARTPEQTLSRVLQELRNAGMLEFMGNGEYRLVSTAYR